MHRPSREVLSAGDKTSGVAGGFMLKRWCFSSGILEESTVNQWAATHQPLRLLQTVAEER